MSFLFFYLSLFFNFTLSQAQTPATSFTESSLLGAWTLQKFLCEDGLQSEAEKEDQQNPFATLSTAPVKVFKPLNDFSDQILIPLGKDQTCTTIGVGKFKVSQNLLQIFLNTVTSPDCPGLVSAFNQDLENNNLFEYEFQMSDRNTLLLYQPLINGETDFRCGKTLRVIEVWKKNL